MPETGKNPEQFSPLETRPQDELFSQVIPGEQVKSIETGGKVIEPFRLPQKSEASKGEHDSKLGPKIELTKEQTIEELNKVLAGGEPSDAEDMLEQAWGK